MIRWYSGVRDTTVNKTEKIPCPHRTYAVTREDKNNQDKFKYIFYKLDDLMHEEDE